MARFKPKRQPADSEDLTEVAHTTAQIRAAHRLEASLLQTAVDRITSVIGGPGFVASLSLGIALWVGGNLVAPRLGLEPLDPAPFFWLQLVTATSALVVAALILTTQRREDKLADNRAQLILELAIANDQKIAKIVGLLEESRRDNPNLVNRVDDEAEAMSTPSDTEAVLEAIKDLRTDLT